MDRLSAAKISSSSSSTAVSVSSNPSSSTIVPFSSLDQTTLKEFGAFFNQNNSVVNSRPQPPPVVEIESLSVIYASSEFFVAFLAIVGNLLVVYVFCTNRSLRRYRNYYVVALAVADFLVGLLGIPLAVLANVGLPRNLYGCLFTLSILMVLCTISILCLVAVSIDRYWATTNPFAYYRNCNSTTSVSIILSCWFVGAIIGFLPLFGWYNHDGFDEEEGYCLFVKVMDYNYLVFLYFSTIIFPALLMAGFYGYIYHIVLIKIRQKGTLAPQGGRRPSETSRSGSLNSDLRGSTQMLRIIVSEKRREAKAAKKLSIIVLFFMICWMPLYTINCVQAFCDTCFVPQQLLDFTIILSHANSALNPFLYAYHLKEFRLAMKSALCRWFGCLFCGFFTNSTQKEGSNVVSRSQTMPSIGNTNSSLTASQTFAAAKYSIKFRRAVDSKVNDNSQNGTRRQLSPEERAKRLLTSSTPSRDNLLRPITNDVTMTDNKNSQKLSQSNGNNGLTIHSNTNKLSITPMDAACSSTHSEEEEKHSNENSISSTSANAEQSIQQKSEEENNISYSAPVTQPPSSTQTTTEEEVNNQGNNYLHPKILLSSLKQTRSAATLGDNNGEDSSAPPKKSLSFNDTVEVGF